MSDERGVLDAALAGWLSRQAAAEERLTAFAFHEGQPAIAVPAPTSLAAVRSWLLATVADHQVSACLRGIGDDGRQVAELAAGGVLGLEPGDRVALAARLGVLAASGLIARDLEADRVTLTALGRAALALAAAPEPAR